jgi:hypothetical protein
MNILKEWMRLATPDHQLDFVTRSGTTKLYINQLSGGFRYPSPELAARMEHVSAEMHIETDGWLPRIYRTDLCKACRVCDIARKAYGVDAQRSDFVSLMISRSTPTSLPSTSVNSVLLTITDLSEGTVVRVGFSTVDGAKERALSEHHGFLAWKVTPNGFSSNGGERHYFITFKDQK